MSSMKETTGNMKEPSVQTRGFISTAFLIAMCTMMSLIAAKADYVYKADTVYKKLEDFEELFEIEAHILAYVKCVLVKDMELDDFSERGVYVSVYNSSNGYDLYFMDYVMEVDVYENQVVNFSVRKLN